MAMDHGPVSNRTAGQAGHTAFASEGVTREQSISFSGMAVSFGILPYNPRKSKEKLCPQRISALAGIVPSADAGLQIISTTRAGATTEVRRQTGGLGSMT